jgi:hypothetical protein
MPRTRRAYEFIAQHPQPGDDPVARLCHVVELFDDTDPNEFAVLATSNVYDDGERTGLTFGDLRALAAQLT